MKRKLLLVFLALLLADFKTYAKEQPDSLKTVKHFHLPPTITYTNNFSASYVQYKNWKYNGNNSYSFLLRSNVNYDSTGNNWETHLRFNGELGYLKFIDSTWVKNTDYFDFAADVVKKTGKRFENVFSFYFSSQFLSAYENIYNDSGLYAKHWISGFGSPMNIDIGYGATIHFWKTNRIDLTFVTLHTSTMPLLDNEVPDKASGIIYKNTLISSEYGLGIQTYIRKSIGKRIRWENNSRFFANAINRQKCTVDFRNRVIVKIVKYLDFIVDSRIRYAPYPPYKFQFRNELMLSFTFEKV
ncbi:MAG: hypothetical protein JWP12_1945 [Bacteroidetes bacterium]|nr:hypothetical protein [Bacteroidota bacterium]